MINVSRLSPDVRERVVRLVRGHTKDHALQWATMASIAVKLGYTAESLRR